MPDLTGIATGGEWPSFALKIKMLGVMIDIDLNLGKLLGALKDMLMKALKQCAAFFAKLWEGIKAWFVNLINSIHITIKTCRKLTCGVEEWNSCTHIGCVCKSCRHKRFGCDQWSNCQAKDCGCNACRHAKFGCELNRHCQSRACGCASCRGRHCGCGSTYGCGFRNRRRCCRHDATCQGSGLRCSGCGVNACRTSRCGCERDNYRTDSGIFGSCPRCGAKTCRTKSCGCELAKHAQDGYYFPDVTKCPRCGTSACPGLLCGAKTYKSCKNPLCGIDFYVSRRRLVEQEQALAVRRVRLMG